MAYEYPPKDSLKWAIRLLDDCKALLPEYEAYIEGIKEEVGNSGGQKFSVDISEFCKLYNFPRPITVTIDGVKTIYKRQF